MGSHSGQGDFAELQEIMGELEERIDALRRAGCQYAANESDYRKALRVRVLEERAAGTPVSIISDVCRGDQHIADLKRARDCSEALYRAEQEAINVKKLHARVIDAQIGREWSRPSNG